METVSGVNSVARGNPEASLKSGTALALVQSMALQFISGLQNNYVKLLENLGTSLITILKDYAKTPKTIALVGNNKRSLLKEFTGDDINSINRVMVSVGNPLSHTTAGRVQMAEQMLQMGIITDPKQYFQVLNTGELESVFESDMNELLLIKRENEMLMEGKTTLAEILDDHKLHIMEHRSVMADPDLRMDPHLRAIVQDHIQQHITMLRTVDPDLLMLTGQQPLQAPGAPQQAPPMPGMAPPPPPGGMGPPSGGAPVQHVIHHQGGQGGPPPSHGPGSMPHPSQRPPPPSQGGPSQHKQNPMMKMMAPPAPPMGGSMMLGQGSKGANLVPMPAHPPAPFQNLPTNAANLLPK